MFHSNGIISACLALVVLLSSAEVLAENDKSGIATAFIQ